ncbi:hypothetical protein, partial [Paenibacillus xylanexedens]|uniref:hypothetical protein n=1 Tax=Paenibacillus xylanexedens TaxID=528191 RepID=UPI001C931246
MEGRQGRVSVVVKKVEKVGYVEGDKSGEERRVRMIGVREEGGKVERVFKEVWKEMKGKIGVLCEIDEK